MTQSVGNSQEISGDVFGRSSEEIGRIASTDEVSAVSQGILREAGEESCAWRRVYLRFEEDCEQVSESRDLSSLDPEVIEDACLLHNQKTLRNLKRPSQLSFEEVVAAFHSTSREELRLCHSFELPSEPQELEEKIAQLRTKEQLKEEIDSSLSALDAARGQEKTWGEILGGYYNPVSHLTEKEREKLEVLVERVDKEEIEGLQKPQSLKGHLCKMFLDRAFKHLEQEIGVLRQEIAELEEKINETKNVPLPLESEGEIDLMQNFGEDPSEVREEELVTEPTASDEKTPERPASSGTESSEAVSPEKVDGNRKPLYTRKSALLPVAGLVAVVTLLIISAFIAGRRSTVR